MTLPISKRPTRNSKLGPTMPPDNSRSRSRLMPAILCKTFEVYAELEAAKAAEIMERLG